MKKKQLKQQLGKIFAQKDEERAKLYEQYQQQQDHIHSLQTRISHSLPLYQKIKHTLNTQTAELTLKAQEAKLASASKDYVLSQMEDLTQIGNRLGNRQPLKKSKKKEPERKNMSSYERLQKMMQPKKTDSQDNKKSHSFKYIKHSYSQMANLMQEELKNYQFLKTKLQQHSGKNQMPRTFRRHEEDDIEERAKKQARQRIRLAKANNQIFSTDRL